MNYPCILYQILNSFKLDDNDRKDLLEYLIDRIKNLITQKKDDIADIFGKGLFMLPEFFSFKEDLVIEFLKTNPSENNFNIFLSSIFTEFYMKNTRSEKILNLLKEISYEKAEYYIEKIRKNQEKFNNLDYSINLIWIYNKINNTEEFIFPKKDRNNRDIWPHIDGWARKNPNTSINLWYDSKFVLEEQKENTIKKIDDFNSLYNAKISLRDIRELDIVKREKDSEINIFDREDSPVYFRVDILRFIATMETINLCENACYFVYADVDVTPQSKEELFDTKTMAKLEKIGIVFTKQGAKGYENSFHIIRGGKNPSELTKSLKEAINISMIELNIARAKNYLKMNAFDRPDSLFETPELLRGKSSLAQIIFASVKRMIQYLYHLLNYGKLLSAQGEDLEKEIPEDYFGNDGVPKNVDDRMKFIEDEKLKELLINFEQKPWLIVPSKDVELPLPKGGGYD